MRLVAAALLTLCLVSCESEQDVSPGPWADLTQVPADTFIVLQRDGCFGTCASFRAHLKADGSVEYEGFAYVAQFSSVTSSVPAAQVLDLLRAAGDIGFSSLELDDKFNRRCNPYVTEGTLDEVWIRADGVTNRVWRDGGCPDDEVRSAVRELEDQIEVVLVKDEWLRPPRSSPDDP